MTLLGAQVRNESTGQTLLKSSALAVAAPLFDGVDRIAMTLNEIGEGLSDRGRLLEENERLREEIATLRLERAQTMGAETQRDMLLSAFGYGLPESPDAIVAEVIYADYSSLLQTLVIRRLPDAGPVDQDVDPDVDLDGEGREVPTMEQNASVVNEDGLIGRLVAVAGAYGRVQLITDRASSVGAMIERTRRQGVVHGAGGARLTLDYLPLQADVELGDRVVSAGIDGVYPRGFPLGVVVGVDRGEELFQQIELVPAVDFASLEQIFVLPPTRLPEKMTSPTLENGDR